MKKYLSLTILIILLGLGFIVRLYKINNPLADWHSWRQADTSAVTRNFVKYGVDLLHPRYDDFTDVSGKGLFNPQGYRFVEFPIFNLVHYSLYSLFPKLSLEMWGRLTSVLCALISAATLYYLISRHTHKTIGLLACFYYLFLPYNIYFTRVVLPDPLMVSLVLSALNLFDLYIRRPRQILFILSAIFAALAVLVKPVAVFFLLPMAWQYWQKEGVLLLKNKLFYIFSSFVLIPFVFWRIWMQQYPQGIPANMWLLNGNNIRFKGAFFRWIFSERIAQLILGNWGVYPLIAGIVAAASKYSYFLFFAISSLLYLFTFATGNVQHDYYQIPIIPTLAIFLAIGTYQLWKKESSFLATLIKRSILAVSLLFMFSFSWYDVRGYYQVNHWEIVHAGQAVDRLLPKDAIVIAPYMGDTAFLYQTNRPGFPYLYMPVKDLRDLYHAWYYVSVNYDAETNTLMNKYQVLEKTPEYVIIWLQEPIAP